MRAQGIINSAQHRDNEILANHTLIEQAQKEASAIRAQAVEYSNCLRKSVNEDLEALLSDAEAALAESLKIITRAKCSFNKDE